MSLPPTIRLGFSPCPNDTFIFGALLAGKIATDGVRIEPVIEDVEALNRRALRGELEATKISFHAFGHIRDRYALLGAGSALGRGCGPLVVAREPMEPEALRRGKVRIAIPGELTTAALLLRLFAPLAGDFIVCPFHEVFDAVASGRADAGAIIHEGRFTYRARGLHQVIDLGEWWEAETGLPLPLGGILARRDLGTDAIGRLGLWVRRSVESARKDPSIVWEFVRRNAQEMEESVIRAHIELYVNDWTVELGGEGRRAVAALIGEAEKKGIVPRSAAQLFA